MTVTDRQKEALEAVLSRHNLAILGQAGVGKTFLVNHIKDELKRKGLQVIIACTNGVACENYSNAMTIDCFCGIKDGRYCIQELHQVLDREEGTRYRLCHTVLIIDEISMLSYKMLCQIEAVCRIARNSQEMFGGMQVIVYGDFFQLQPVPNTLYGDRGDYAFIGPLWNAAFPHHIIPDEGVRQSEIQLITAVRETSRGIVSQATVDSLESVSRPLEGPEDVVRVFATNQQVDIHNQRTLMNLQGDLKIFYSKDWGGKKTLEKDFGARVFVAESWMSGCAAEEPV